MAQNTIKCTHCGKEVEITEALSHELEEKIEKQVTQKVREEAIKKVQEQYKAKIEATKEESLEVVKQNSKLQEELSEIMKQLREAKNIESKLKIEFEKRLMDEQEKIKDIALKEAKDELNLEILTKNKKLEDAQKQIDELKRKLSQGSQQLQGEVIELQIEEKLKSEFPDDKIEEVPKGIRGADVIQKVYSKSGNFAGTICWEVKNTKTWTEGWVSKLKQDQRSLKAELGVLITNVLPEGIKSFGIKNGIWVTDVANAFSLAYVLRQQLIKVSQAKLANEGKQSNAELVYDYLTSNEFRQRIEVIVEYFGARRDEINKERNYFLKKWEQEEQSIFKAMSGTVGIYGDLQGITGSALPKISNLELPDEV